MQTINEFKSGPKFLELRSRNWKPSHAHIKVGFFSNIKICYKLNSNILFSPNKEEYMRLFFLLLPGIFPPQTLYLASLYWRTLRPLFLKHFSHNPRGGMTRGGKAAWAKPRIFLLKMCAVFDNRDSRYFTAAEEPLIYCAALRFLLLLESWSGCTMTNACARNGKIPFIRFLLQ